jgi:Holliday junction resolvase RusA-like endonuclease
MRASDLPAHLRPLARAALADAGLRRPTERRAALTPGEGAIGPQARSSREPGASAPVVLTLPVAYLVPDNARAGVLGGRVLLTRRYRQAKAALALVAAAQWRGPPWAGPVTLVATLYPKDRRRRDAGNCRKQVTDALQGIAYHDDAQLTSETWRLGPVAGRDARLELTLSRETPDGL